jgi:hypothetical protein
MRQEEDEASNQIEYRHEKLTSKHLHGRLRLVRAELSSQHMAHRKIICARYGDAQTMKTPTFQSRIDTALNLYLQRGITSVARLLRTKLGFPSEQGGSYLTLSTAAPFPTCMVNMYLSSFSNTARRTQRLFDHRCTLTDPASSLDSGRG